MNPAGNLSYDVFVNDPPPQDGLLPNGQPKRFSPTASTLIYGAEDAVLTDPGLTADQARVLGDWVAGKDRNLTDIFITHGHGDHWFAAGLLAEELLRSQTTAVGFFNAKLERYPNHLGRMILWVSASALYGVREHPGQDAGRIILASWF